MTAVMRETRGLAFYMALMLLVLAPFQGMGTIRAQQPPIGLKTVVLGGALGIGALFALKAMFGPASAVATVGAAGTGFATSIGSAAGGVMSGISSFASSLATGASSMFAGIGRMMTTGLSGAASMVTQPWFYVPAALIAGGLLIYHFHNRSKAGVNGHPVSGIPRPLGFFDRLRLIVRTPGSLVRPILAPAPYSNSFYSGMSRFYTGGQPAFGVNSLHTLNGYGATASLATAGVSGIGEPLRAGIDASVSNRASMQPAAPINSKDLQSQLDQAELSRKAAYDRLVEALRSRASDTAGAADTTDAAIRDYKEARNQVEALKQQLEAR